MASKLSFLIKNEKKTELAKSNYWMKLNEMLNRGKTYGHTDHFEREVLYRKDEIGLKSKYVYYKPSGILDE